jgi:hypothetical protein
MKRAPLKSGDEYDALTRAKKYYIWKSGDRKAIKKSYNKRERKWLDKLLIKEEDK